MSVKKIYRHRFENQIYRQKIWQVLVRNFFQKFISKKDTVIDIGAGYCEFINNIMCYKKYAVDVNSETKKYAGKDVNVLISSSTSIPIQEDSADKIFISNLFEHLTKDEIEKTIQEVFRILKKSGKVLVLQPNIRLCSKDYWMFFDHITPIDDRALGEIFSVYGFRIRYKILRFLPYTTKSSLSKYSWLVFLYLRLRLLWRFFGKQSFLIFEKQ